MSPLVLFLLLALCTFASAVFSGSETGFYSLSRGRVDLEATQGGRVARIVQWLLENDSALLVTILIGNNLAIELATHFSDPLATHFGVPSEGRELYLTAMLSPVLFFFGEVLPKELFRSRPHTMIAFAAPFVFVSRVVFWPLERMLGGLTVLLERLFGLDQRVVTRLRGREAVMGFLAEGLRAGALTERAEVLARNALELRSTPIERVMVPWSAVHEVDLAAGQETAFEAVKDSRFSRLPVRGSDGQLAGYVHQIDVLADGVEVPVEKAVRNLPLLAPEIPVDRALLTLRGSGRRVAAVGRAEEQPLGLLTLKDLVEEISGDLAGL